MKAPADLAATDAGRRLSDAVNQAAANGQYGMWVAGRLSDGQTDGIVYPTRGDAVRHQLHETQCCYVLVPPNGMGPLDATAYLAIHRKLYEAGARLIDPDDPDRHVVPTLRTELGGRLPLNRADRRRLDRGARRPGRGVR